MSPRERDAYWKGLQDKFADLATRFDPTSPQVRLSQARALIQAGNAMGGIRSGNTGDFAAAHSAYETARAELVTLHAQEPNDEVIWSEAVEAQMRVADVLRRTNKPTEALDGYKRAIELAEGTIFPVDSLDIQRQRSKPRMALGQTAVLLGDATLAKEMFDREENDRRARAMEYPDSLNARRDLAIVLLNSGELSAAMKDANAASSKLDESLALRRAMLAQRATHPTLLRDVATGQIARSIHSADLGNTAEARERLDEALSILSSLAETTPDDARLPFTAATALIEYASASVRAGSDAVAAQATEEAQAYIEKLDSIAPQHPALSTLRARRRLLIAQGQFAAGNTAVAAQSFELARDQIAAIASFDPSNINNRLLHGDALAGLGETRRLLAEEAGDEAAVEQALLLIQEARRVYETCGAPGDAFGPAQRWWAIVQEQMGG